MCVLSLLDTYLFLRFCKWTDTWDWKCMKSIETVAIKTSVDGHTRTYICGVLKDVLICTTTRGNETNAPHSFLIEYCGAFLDPEH